MNIICLVMITVNVGGVLMANTTQVKGTLLKKGQNFYYVDFAKGLEEGQSLFDSTDTKLLVPTNKCEEL